MTVPVPIYIPRQTATDYPVYPKRGRQVYGSEKTAEVLGGFEAGVVLSTITGSSNEEGMIWSILENS
jgi:hypothetical protein